MGQKEETFPGTVTLGVDIPHLFNKEGIFPHFCADLAE